MKNFRVVTLWVLIGLLLSSCLGAMQPAAPAFPAAVQLTAEEAITVINNARNGLGGTQIMKNIQSEAWLFAELYDTGWKVVMLVPVKNKEMMNQIKFTSSGFSDVFDALAKKGWMKAITIPPSVQAFLASAGAFAGDFLMILFIYSDGALRQEVIG
jgi:hypothetical protein